MSFKYQPPVDPATLFDECSKRENALNKTDFSRLRQALGNELMFSRPFFFQDVGLDTISDSDPNLLKMEKMARLGAKYRDLLRLLRAAKDRRTLRVVLVQWLMFEKVISSPEQLLGKTDKLRNTDKRISILGEELRHFIRVTIWLPYFTRLLGDMKELPSIYPGQVETELVKLGYKKEAVENGLGKRSPKEATYYWLGSRKYQSVGLIRNAHSKLAKKFRKALRKLPPKVRRNIFQRELKELGWIDIPLD